MANPNSLPAKSFEEQLEDIVLSDFGIGVDGPTLKRGIVDSLIELARNTPGTISHTMAEREAFESAWGDMDEGEEIKMAETKEPEAKQRMVGVK